MHTDSAIDKNLEARLQHYLPGARLQFQELPDCRGLRLLLIEPDYDDRNLSPQQIELLSDDPPYWIFCWASGRALAQQILCGRVAVQDKVILDFGSGSGVVAIAAAMAGAKRVYACDVDDVCCQLIACNAKYNQVDIQIVHSMDQVQEEVDLVLAADVLYERTNLVFLDWMLAVSARVIVADSRLKSMPDTRFHPFDMVFTSSYPDYQEAKANNQVILYQAEWGG